MQSSTLLLLILPSFSLCRHLPSSFKKCKRTQYDYKDCLVKAVEDAVRQLNHPFKGVGLPSLEPLVIPSMTVAAGTGAANFQQNYKNFKITGFTNVTFSKFDVDFDKKIIELECKFPQLTANFDYVMDGKILVLPFYGSGPGVIRADEIKFFFTFNLEEFEQKGAKYYKIAGYKLKMDPKLVYFHLDNLFNGDKNMGDHINEVLNENWRDIYSDAQEGYEQIVGSVLSAVFGKFLQKVSVSDIFP